MRERGRERERERERGNLTNEEIVKSNLDHSQASGGGDAAPLSA